MRYLFLCLLTCSGFAMADWTLQVFGSATDSSLEAASQRSADDCEAQVSRYEDRCVRYENGKFSVSGTPFPCEKPTEISCTHFEFLKEWSCTSSARVTCTL